MTASIAEPCPEQPPSQAATQRTAHRPVLRRLVDILPATPEPPREPPPTRPVIPDPAAAVLAERVLRAAVEILNGRRPARQLAAVLRPELLSYLVLLKATAGHLEPRVHKVLTQQHASATLEAVALVTLRTGVRALAARFDKHGGQWRCTALQLRLTTGDIRAGRW